VGPSVQVFLLGGLRQLHGGAWLCDHHMMTMLYRSALCVTVMQGLLCLSGVCREVKVSISSNR